MNKKFNAEPCPICGEGTWVPKQDDVHCFSHKNVEHIVTGLHYAQCDHCQAKGYIPGQLDENQRLIREYQQKNLTDFISPADIYMIRAKYMLSRAQAAKIFRVDEQMIRAWESGKAIPSGLETRTLKMVLNNQSELVALAKEVEMEIEVSHDNESESANPWVAVDGQTIVQIFTDFVDSQKSFENARNMTRHLTWDDVNIFWARPQPTQTLPGYSNMAIYPPWENNPDFGMERCADWISDMSGIQKTAYDKTQQQISNQSKAKAKRSHKNREAEAA